jgi:fructuronate reductase
MKLRLLNGSHSSIAYLGQLAGSQTVQEAIADPALVSFIKALMKEVAATLRMPESVDLSAYRSALLIRFANPALKHRTAQIAMDGSQKMPPRLFAPALDLLTRGLSAPNVALATAAWLRFLQGRDDKGATLSVDDPMKDALLKAVRSATDLRSSRDAIFAMQDIVPPQLAASADFRDLVLTALELLTTRGVPETLNEWNKGEAP